MDALLQDSQFGIEVTPPVFVEPRAFANRREAGAYLDGQLQPLGAQQIAGNHELWSWLGMFYLEQAIPRTAPGTLRWSESDAPYVLNPGGEGRGESQGHRHRLMAAYEIYRRRRESEWCVMLDQPVSSMEHFAERLLGAPLLFNAVGVVDLAQELYTDRQQRNYKQGFQGAGGRQRPPGGLVRLIDVLNQLSMTYDVYGMAANQLLPLPPAGVRGVETGGGGITAAEAYLGRPPVSGLLPAWGSSRGRGCFPRRWCNAACHCQSARRPPGLWSAGRCRPP